MPECPQFGCRGGQIEDGDGDGQAWHRTCETCGGTGEVSEEWMEEQREKERRMSEESSRWAERAVREENARQEYVSTHTFCLKGGEVKPEGVAGWFSRWYKCRYCGMALCEKHASEVAERASFFSAADYLCPYCKENGRKAGMFRM